jgi:thiol-disulfide isomerase/thioredoxin
MSTTARIAVGIFMMVFAGWLVFASAAAAPPDGTVELKTIKYPDLVKAVRSQRGKVIVVDLWGDFCAPCKREFPHLVELHQQYGDKGLVCMCMSVALDPPADPNSPAPPPNVLKFLVAKKATFANYWLNEDEQVWKRFGIEAVPAVFVFDRQGRRAAKFTENFTYADVRKVVEKLLPQQ